MDTKSKTRRKDGKGLANPYPIDEPGESTVPEKRRTNTVSHKKYVILLARGRTSGDPQNLLKRNCNAGKLCA